ncbi:RsmB/NOP family class I SAM-dependent RNA methyltransferase [Roseovarius phycicola]|uniref:RsmB/NOP family class I SAM-dependent RNA methyltransferase n=1 Tax=Roseovarius phycicola TaxID=3080976 RepID=A0ABZ2HDS3_9RHOB
MTPAARVQAAIEVLDHINECTPAEKALTTWARGARYAGSGDRAAVRDHVFQALRCRRSYAALGGGTDGRALLRGALIEAGVAPETVFTGERHAPAVLDDAELMQGRVPEVGAEQADLPDWLWDRFESAFGSSEAMRSAQVLRQRAPVTLRVNAGLSNVSQAIEILNEDGVAVTRISQCDTALIVAEGARRVAGSRAYREGHVELQDASSQAAMAALDIAPGARVLDYCAGGGGKTLALAARVDATWFAHDANFTRMKDLPDRAHRAGIQVTCLDSDAITTAAPFDLVLCDAPCSGSGTWRRAPEAKWRLTPERLEELRATQLTILENAEQHVAPGGQLVYATCSILLAENDRQVAEFLSRHSAWTLTKQMSWPVTEEGDGFFLACLTKAG